MTNSLASYSFPYLFCLFRVVKIVHHSLGFSKSITEGLKQDGTASEILILRFFEANTQLLFNAVQ